MQKSFDKTKTHVRHESETGRHELTVVDHKHGFDLFRKRKVLKMIRLPLLVLAIAFKLVSLLFNLSVPDQTGQFLKDPRRLEKLFLHEAQQVCLMKELQSEEDVFHFVGLAK